MPPLFDVHLAACEEDIVRRSSVAELVVDELIRMRVDGELSPLFDKRLNEVACMNHVAIFFYNSTFTRKLNLCRKFELPCKTPFS